MEALIFMGVSIIFLIAYFIVAAHMKKEKEVKRTTSDNLNEIRRKYNIQSSRYEALPGKILVEDTDSHKFLFANTVNNKLQCELVDLLTVFSCEIEKTSSLDHGVIIIDKLGFRFKFIDAINGDLLIPFYDRKIHSPIEGPLHLETAKKWIKSIEKHWKPIMKKSA